MNRTAIEWPESWPRWAEWLMACGATAVAYAAVAITCIGLSRFGGVVAQIWLPNALVLLALGPAGHLRNALYVGAALGSCGASLAFDEMPVLAAWLAAANILEILCASKAVALARGGVVTHGMQRLVMVWLLGAVGAPAVSAVMASTGLAFFTAASLAGSFRGWLMSNVFAMALVLPWLVRDPASGNTQDWARPHVFEFAGLLVLSLAASIASVRYLEWPFIAASLIPLLTAARLPLGPQIALAGGNAVTLLVMVNLEAGFASQRFSGADPLSLSASAIATFLPSIFIAFVFDSLRQQAQALEGEEARWRSVMQSSPIGMALVTPGGEFVEANAALARMLGYTTGELLGGSMHEITDAADIEATREAEAEVARGVRDVVRLQKRYRRKDGSLLTAIVALSALRGPDGRLRLLLEQIEDITGRLHAERELADALARQRAEARFRAAVEVAPTAMVIVDQAGNVTMVNAQVERAFGWKRAELIGRSIEVLVPARFRSEHLAQRRAFLAAPKTRRMGEGRDLYALRKDGSEFPVEVGLAAFETGEGAFVLAALVDITQRKRGEADILRANADLEEFAYIVSHDLRTPLRAIENLVDWIDEDIGANRSAGIERNLDRLRLRVRRMENMIQDLFNYSRVGRAQVAGELITIDALVRHLVEDLAVPRTFRVEVRDAAGPLRAARTPLETVLRNLLANAIKHHDADGGSVVVETRMEGASCIITVTDDGPGIARQDQARIFQLFQTLAPAQGEQIGGIGLAVVKKWAEASGGSIHVESPVAGGRGCRFIVRWPLAREQAGEGTRQA